MQKLANQLTGDEVRSYLNAHYSISCGKLHTGDVFSGNLQNKIVRTDIGKLCHTLVGYQLLIVGGLYVVSREVGRNDVNSPPVGQTLSAVITWC
jgi:hypothetical protein